MTVASSTNRSGPFAGDGSTKIFTFAIQTLQAADVKVISTTPVNSVNTDTALVLNTDFSVSLNSDQSASPGGSVTLVVAPPVGTSITVLRNIAMVQPASLPNQGGFYPKVLEGAFDKLTMIVQQIEEEVARSIKGSAADGVQTVASLTAAATAATAAQVALAAASAASAAGSAVSASGSAGSATGSASAASSSAGAAAGSATAAATSATAAAISAGSVAPTIVKTYDLRGDLRSLPAASIFAAVESLGIFVWIAGSTEVDDDETCFAATGGCWELKATDPDYVYARDALMIDDVDGRLSGLQARFLGATFGMTLTSLTSLSSSQFTVAMPGASPGDIVLVTPGDQFGTSGADKGALHWAGAVLAPNFATVSVRNASASGATLTSSTWSVLVIKQ